MIGGVRGAEAAGVGSVLEEKKCLEMPLSNHKFSTGRGGGRSAGGEEKSTKWDTFICGWCMIEFLESLVDVFFFFASFHKTLGSNPSWYLGRSIGSVLAGLKVRK